MFRKRGLKPRDIEWDYGIIQRDGNEIERHVAQAAYEMSQEKNPIVMAYGAGYIKGVALSITVTEA